MIPQAKAKELVNNFYDHTKHSLRSFPEAYEAAKKCALLLCDEILASISYHSDEQPIYWQQVRYYIEYKQ